MIPEPRTFLSGLSLIFEYDSRINPIILCDSYITLTDRLKLNSKIKTQILFESDLNLTWTEV